MNETEYVSLAFALFHIVFVTVLFITLLILFTYNINKTISSEKVVFNPSVDFLKSYKNELQFKYHLTSRGSNLELTSDHFQDIITIGVIKLEIKETADEKRLRFSFKRTIKPGGYIIIIFSLFLCYIGILIPILIVHETKKRSLNEIDGMFSIAKSLLNQKS